MLDDDLKKILFVLTLLKNKVKDDQESVAYANEAIEMIMDHLVIGLH